MNALRTIRDQLCLRPEFMAERLKIHPETLERLEAGQFDNILSEISPRLEQRLRQLGWWDGRDPRPTA